MLFFPLCSVRIGFFFIFAFSFSVFTSLLLLPEPKRTKLHSIHNNATYFSPNAHK